jgi:hypothetical protein
MEQVLQYQLSLMNTDKYHFKDFIIQKNQNSVANEEPSFVDPVSLAKVTSCLLVNAFEETKNKIPAPSEPK